MSLLPLVGLIGGTSGVLFLIGRMTVLLRQRVQLAHRSLVTLTVTPPRSAPSSLESMEHFLRVLHHLSSTRRLFSLFKTAYPLSFEIASSETSGIEFQIIVEAAQVPSVEEAIAAYLPQAIVSHSPTTGIETTDVFTIHQHASALLPLITFTPLDHDPLSYILSTLSQVKGDEKLRLQLILTPLFSHSLEKKSPRELLDQLHSSLDMNLFSFLLTMVSRFLFALLDLFRSSSLPERSSSRPSFLTSLTPDEETLLNLIRQKATRPQFAVSFRVLIKSDVPKKYYSSFRSNIAAFSGTYQQLDVRITSRWKRKRFIESASLRLPPLTHYSSLFLSTKEIAGLFHLLPVNQQLVDTTVTNLSRTLPPPLSLKGVSSKDLYLGENIHRGTLTPIGLDEAERERHVFMIGGTGNGKTTLMQQAIIQDMQQGKGLAVIDPHGDMATTLLSYVPEERLLDVIYLDPNDLEHILSLNLLELSPALTEEDSLREKDRITETTISLMRKIFSDDDSGGHRIEYILRNAIQTALTLEKPTLFTIFQLLNDAKFRRQAIAPLEDENLKLFWSYEMGKAGDMQRIKMSSGITAKIGRFLFSVSARRFLEQYHSSIDFSALMDQKKILICNFSKGLLGEDTSSLFGMIVLAKLQLAALRRAEISETERSPFYLYVDEFQNFATMSFVQILSEARKYKLSLFMAEQSTSQQEQRRLVDIILANVGTVICFKTGSPADEEYLLPLFSPFLSKGDIAYLPSYSFYIKLGATRSQEPTSGRTIVLPPLKDRTKADRVREMSRSHYGTTPPSRPKEELKKTRAISPTPKTSKQTSSSEYRIV